MKLIKEHSNSSNHQGWSVKEFSLNISKISQENTCVGVSDTCVVQRNLQSFKNTYFEEHLRTTASITSC